jgi:hypothetical protein
VLSQQKKRRMSHDKPDGETICEVVRQSANAYIVSHYPFGCLGGTPRRLVLKNLCLWVIPVFLTSPGVGPVGEVGVVAVNDRTAKVVGGTERQEVAAAVRTLKTNKHHDLEAAFLRSRTG